MPERENIFDYEPVMPSRRGTRASASIVAEDFAAPADTDNDEDFGAAHLPASSVSATDEATSQTDAQAETRRVPRLKRGHLLSYLGLFLFTAVLYFRPYELFPALMAVPQMAFWLAIATLAIFIPTQFALEGTLTVRTREVKLLLLLLTLALLSIPLALDPLAAWDDFNYSFLKVAIMFVVIVNTVRTEWRLRGLLFLSLAVSAFLSVRALADYHAGLLTVEGYRVKGSLGGMFENPNDMALYLATVIPLALALLMRTRGPVRRLLYGLCAGLLTAALMVTFSRGGFLGLAAGLGVLLWKLGRRHRLGVVVLLVLIGVLFVALAPENYGLRLFSILDKSRDFSGSSVARQDVLIRSLMVTARHPLLGIGIGNFHTLSIHEAVTHNAYTQVSAEMGIPALVVYVAFMLTALRRLKWIEWATRGNKERRRYYYLAVGLQASLVAYMVSSFFASVAYLWYVYYIVGYAICLRRMYEAETGEIVTKETAQAAIAEHAQSAHAPPTEATTLSNA